MSKQEMCEQKHCYLPKGHDGLHKAIARIYDIEDEFIDYSIYTKTQVKVETKVYELGPLIEIKEVKND